jgi:hypothetical protein
MLSGVNNRNHCPYCLWSCHLDLFAAGDRLSACKGQMRPIGLTMKKSRNKYRLEAGGELMLVHACIECGTLSINRIAADDVPESIMEAFNESLLLGYPIRARCEQKQIRMLGPEDSGNLYSQLHGQYAEISQSVWA